MIYFFSLYVLKNFFDFPSRYSLYVFTSLRCVTCFVFDGCFRTPYRLFTLVFDDGFLFSISPPVAVSVSLFFSEVSFVRFGSAKVRTFFEFPNFIFYFFSGPDFLRFFIPLRIFFRRLRAAKV